MKKIYNSHLSISQPWANIYPKKTIDDEVYYKGLYYCKDGVVECTSELERNITYFRFVYQGTLYMQTIEKAYSQRGLAIMAGKFVKGIIINKTNE